MELLPGAWHRVYPCRAYRKNDQAWVEQKNGAIVRKLIGYGRLQGLTATAALRRVDEASRWYINFFQPSFKLKSKYRQGARVHKNLLPARDPVCKIDDTRGRNV